MGEKGMAGKKHVTDAAVVIKGAGEMASGIGHRLYRAGITRIVMLEAASPLCVRRFVSFCEAVHDGTAKVEDIRARLVSGASGVATVWQAGEIAVMVDPGWNSLKDLKPDIVIDAIMAKRNLGTRKDEAPFVIGVGPGFTAPRDVHAVVESNRGHDLGRVIYSGSAEPYTGVPGEIKGIAKERVLRAPVGGSVKHVHHLGDDVRKGDLVLYVDDAPVYAPFDGIVTTKYVEVGAMISQGTPIVAMQDPSDNWVNFKVKETELSGYTLNKKVSLRGRDDKLVVEGVIVDISKKPEFATFRATGARGDSDDIIAFNVKVRTNSVQVRPGMRFCIGNEAK